MWKSTANPHPRIHSTHFLNANVEEIDTDRNGEEQLSTCVQGEKTQSEMEEEIRLSTASKNHGKNNSNPNRRLNQQQARIVDENHDYFTYTAKIVPLRPLFQLAACTKPKEKPD